MKLQNNIDLFNKRLRKINMKINSDKTNIMVVGQKKKNDDIRIDGQQKEQVIKFRATIS